jgi:hypothetical protein
MREFTQFLPPGKIFPPHERDVAPKIESPAVSSRAWFCATNNF